jgi:hypothetical protein
MMDYEAVNDVLARANAEFERQELEDLQSYEIDDAEVGKIPTNEDLDRIEEQEGYVGVGGTEPPDYSPSGNPIAGGDLGVDNLATDAEQYMSYIASMGVAVSTQTGVSDDDALEAIYAVADQMAEGGSMPPMPDIESAPADELAQWTGAATTIGLLARVIDYVTAGKDKQNVTVPMGEPTGRAPTSDAETT